MRPPVDRRAQLFVLASGACALAYQSAWIRQLRLLFGASTAASAAVLGIFMGGLGLGAWRFARRVDAHPEPLRLYAQLEAGVAVLALASLPLLSLVEWVYLALGGQASLGTFVAVAVRLVSTSLVIGAPAMLMGATLPAIVRATAGANDDARRGVARLYGLNTLGAVIGAVFTTFWGLEFLGISGCIYAAVVVNAGLAAAAWSTSRNFETSPSTPPSALPATEADPNPHAPEFASPQLAKVQLALVLTAAAVFGFVFFAMELVWYRALAPLTGGTTYGFGFVLATALVGIGVGGLLYERWRPAQATLSALALSATLEALALCLAWAVGASVPAWAVQLRALTILGPVGLAGYWLALTSLVVLPAAVVAGYQFPLLVACLGRGREAIGRHVAWAYALNTAGAVAGAIGAGFGLMPLLGVRGLWIGCALALVAVGLALSFATPTPTPTTKTTGARRPARTWLQLALASAVACTLVAGEGPGPRWMHNPIGAGRIGWKDDAYALAAELEQARADLVWSVDGQESSVAVVGRSAYAFRVNGKTDGNATGDAATVVMAPLLGTLIHPHPKRGLVIGLGTGMSAGWMAQVPTIESVDVVELEPALKRFAQMCAPVNRDALDNPRVHLVIADAREWVQTADRQWDVIMSEPSNPYRAGIASLFSVDFYERVHARMSDDGVFVQWLQGYEVDALAIATVLKSLRQVFASVDVFVTSSGDFALVAQRRARPFDLDQIESRLATAPYLEAMQQTWGVHGLEGFLGAHVAGPELADHFAEDPRIDVERDDRPRLEFGFARTLGGDDFVSARELVDAAERVGAQEPHVSRPFDRALRDEARDVLSRTMENDLGREYRPEAAADASRRAARISLDDGDLGAAAEHWLAQRFAPRFVGDQLRMGALWADAADTIRARSMITELAVHRPVDAHLLRARLAMATGDETAVELALLDALALAKHDPWFDEANMRDALRRLIPTLTDEAPARGRRLFTALDGNFAVDALGHERIQARRDLARAIDFRALCREVMREVEPHPPLDGDLLEDRVECYALHHDPRLGAAQRDLERYDELAVSRTLAGWTDR